MRICLRRREFIAALSGAAAWPLGARAQQESRVRRVGVLLNAAATEVEYQGYFGSLRRGNAASRMERRQNLRLDIRWNGGDASHRPTRRS